MNYFEKILGDGTRRLLLLKIAMTAFIVAGLLSCLLGRFDIAVGLIAASYSILGYRKYKKNKALK